MSDDDVQTLLSRATPRRANGDPIENEMTSVNSDVLLAAFDEIERLRARVEVLERVREAALPHLFEPSMASGTKLLKALQEAKP
jgi:hypothetical protein